MGWDEDIFKADGVGAQRYKDLLTAWIGGSPWGHSFTHNMYRPSMASWDDYLWHMDYIMKSKQCGLLRGLNTSMSLCGYFGRSSGAGIAKGLCSNVEKCLDEEE